MRWADLNGLRKIDLGGAINSRQGYEIVDIYQGDISCDLNERWPFEDDSIGVVRAYDIFEHLRDPLHTMKELYRVLAPGGYALIQVPSTDGRGAFQDPTHVSYWNENSFLYYTDHEKARFIHTPVRFQSMRLYTTKKDQQQVCWTVAHLVKLASGMKVPGLVNI
jgi:predicted SAM-dependent methyltransferase